MARPYRLEAENTFYHLTNRGDDKKKIYVSERDREKFLDYVLQAKKRFKFRLYAYVLMANHYHLLIETLQANLSNIMHFINGSYSTYYNIKRKRTGHLFQGRYKSIIVDKDSYFLELTRYIHLNPVKAGIVKSPEEYKWSSYNGYADKKKDRYIDSGDIKNITTLWGKRYEDFVKTSIAEEMDPFKNVYGGILIGSTSFIKDKLDELKSQIREKEGSHKKQLCTHVEKEGVLKLIEKKYGNKIEELRKRRRNCKARKIGIYLMRELTGLTNREIGEVFDMNFSAVSKTVLGVKKEMSKNNRLRKEIKSLSSNFEA
jgi:putative transposase